MPFPSHGWAEQSLTCRRHPDCRLLACLPFCLRNFVLLSLSCSGLCAASLVARRSSSPDGPTQSNLHVYTSGKMAPHHKSMLHVNFRASCIAMDLG